MRKNQQKQWAFAKQSPSQVRIIGGSMRGRKISFVEGEGLRPTLDRVRETVFNWLAADIAGATCLDLYAGSGALGIEAVSRGSSATTLVDSSIKVCQSLTENLKALDISNAEVCNLSAEQFLLNNTKQFDIVFLDPPFGKGLLKEILEKLKPHLTKNAVVYVEQENEKSTYVFSEEWELIKSKKTSSFLYELIRLN